MQRVSLQRAGQKNELNMRSSSMSSRGEGRGEGGTHVMRGSDRGPSHPYNAGTEHLGFPPTRQTLGGTFNYRKVKKTNSCFVFAF